MWFRKNFEILRSLDCYNCYKVIDNYQNNNQLLNFLITLDTIDINQIRYKEKKELLKVLEFIFKNYRLYQIKWIYMSWYSFVNNYCSFIVSEREYVIIEKILLLKEQLWWYYMNNYSTYYNIALDYISKYTMYNNIHNVYHKKKDKPFDKTKPDFKSFPWDYSFNKYWFVDSKFYY